MRATNLHDLSLLTPTVLVSHTPSYHGTLTLFSCGKGVNMFVLQIVGMSFSRTATQISIGSIISTSLKLYVGIV